jgi:hypothetical protein
MGSLATDEAEQLRTRLISVEELKSTKGSVRDPGAKVGNDNGNNLII